MISLVMLDSNGQKPTATEQIDRLRALCDATSSSRIKQYVTPSVLTQIEQRYAQYLQHGGDPKVLASSPFIEACETAKDPTSKSLAESCRDALKHCYSSETTVCKRIKALARSVAASDCPYCAMRFPTLKEAYHHALDHYLPKTHFPEFSILPQNLVQACDGCNSPKRSNFQMSDGTRAFIHPYYTNLGSEPILKASVRDEGGVPVLSFNLDLAHLPMDVGVTVNNHVIELGLFKRWAEYGLEEAMKVLRTYARGWRRRRDEDITREDMQQQAKDEQNQFPNNPAAAALLALSQAPELPTWLDNILPNNQ